jgi:hypothetical protein
MAAGSNRRCDQIGHGGFWATGLVVSAAHGESRLGWKNFVSLWRYAAHGSARAASRGVVSLSQSDDRHG